MKVKLLSYTPDPERLVALAAKQCYNGVSPETINGKMTDEAVGKFVRKLANTGHTPTEHAVFTFSIEGVSRALMAQLTRSRVASFNVASQRYIDEKDFDVVVPESIRREPEALKLYAKIIDDIRCGYKALQAYKIPNEDARYVLPNACCTRIICTMNARELFHFFNLRCCSRAQHEIMELANKMLALCKEVAPNLFAKAGPHCVQYGVCLEERSCGRINALKEKKNEK